MTFSSFDHQCMAQALRLAARGIGHTEPNPRVGCVIARDGGLLAEGWTQQAGDDHAEAHALKQVPEVKGATAYVTLEPCSHYGRTPPCSEALIKAGIKRVVVACKDPFPEVDGSGIQALQSAGIEVQAGLMSDAAEELNQGFFSRVRRGRPWVRVKLAQSLDGKTALENGESQWITGAAARADVQQWRARASVIMTGIGTLLADDPRLTVRLHDYGQQPLRVIVDSHWRTPAKAKIFAEQGKVLIAGCQDSVVADSFKGKRLSLPAQNGRVDLNALMSALAERQVNEVHVEAGAELCGGLLQAGLVDEILLYQAPLLMGDQARGMFNITALASMKDVVQLDCLDSRQIGQDLRLRLRPRYKEDRCLQES